MSAAHKIASFQPHHPAVPRSAGSVAAGGPVAALQQELAERLAAQGVPPSLAAPYAPDALEAAVSGLSRWAGYAALVCAGGATLWWLAF